MNQPIIPKEQSPSPDSDHIERQRRTFVQAFLGSLATLGSIGPLAACSGSGSEPDAETAGTKDLASAPPTNPPPPPAAAPAPPPRAPAPAPAPPPPTPPTTATVPVPPPTTARIDWGSGSDVGTVVGDVWTPGRDGQGRVNRASWESVPKGRWIEVGGTRIDTSLTAEIVNAGLGWTTTAQLWGTSAASNLFQSWSGFAVNQQEGKIFFLGGGHSDGYNNGLYRFDCSRMAWAIECMPSSWTQMSAAYRTNGSSTSNPESASVAVANFNAINPAGSRTGALTPALNGPFYDELPFDNKPTARHTYHSLTFAPNVGSAGSIYMGSRRLWRYDMASQQWVSRRVINDQVRATGTAAAPSATGIMEIHAAEAAFTAYDEVTRRVLVSASGSAGAGAFSYDVTTESWVRWGGSYGLNYNHAAKARVGRTLVALNPPVSDQSVVVGRYWVYNMDTQGVAAANLQFAGGLSLADFPSGGVFYDGEAMAYVGGLHRFWLVTRNSRGGMFWIDIDPTTTPWTASPLTFPNGSPIEQRLPIGRVQWIEGLNAVLAWDHCFTGAKFYRL